MQRLIGVYKITNLINGKFYIGSSTNIQQRLKYHLSLLRNNKHFNIHLQGAFNKYKEENFEFSIIEECLIRITIEREQYYLDTLLFAQEYIRKKNKKFIELGYNLTPVAKTRPPNKNQSNKGRKFTEEHKESLRKAKLASKYSIKSTPILQFDLNGNFIKEWESIREAQRQLKIFSI